MVKKVNEEEFRKEVATGKVVIDFSAEWCNPCKMLAPVIEEISDEMSDVKFLNVDVDEEGTLAAEYKIMSIPAVVVIKDGENKGMLVGFKPKEVLREEIKELF